MKKWRQYFNRAYGMTGTPNSRHLMDLWAEAYCIDGGLTFGESFDFFSAVCSFTKKILWGMTGSRLKWTEEKLFDMLAPFTVRVEAAGGLPDLVELDPRIVTFSPGFMKQYRQMERKFVITVEGENVSAVNSAVAYSKLRQATSGFMYSEDSVVTFDEDKFAELKDLVSALNGEQAVIVYHYKEQLIRLKEYFTNIGHLGGGMSEKESAKILECFRSGQLDLLACIASSVCWAWYRRATRRWL